MNYVKLMSGLWTYRFYRCRHQRCSE